MRIPVPALLFLLLLPGIDVRAQPPAGQSGDLDRPQTIQQLIESVRQGSAQRRTELQEREQRFIDARDQQTALLQEATSRRQEAEAEADRLREAYEQGEDELTGLEDLLTERSGNLTEVFTVVNQVAGDALPMVQNSLVSSQLENRLPLLEKLSSTESLPSADELRQLWLLLLDEMNYSGQIARYEAPVITAGGELEPRQVTRIGTFTALSDGQYLRFLPESGRLLALARQPLGVDPRATRSFENADNTLSPIAIDPSRGAILSLIVQTPELSERLQQGGVIGYIILALGAIGVLLGLERLIAVLIAGRRTHIALADQSTQGTHAIYQLRRISGDPKLLADAEAMSARMDEIVTTAAQKLRRGLATLSIFAAVSPLLGLLGTVTGMIETFQVITLFGAGDPRLMSGGISQALITTQLGLSVAIPLLLIHSFIQGRTNSLITRLDETAADLFARGRAGDSRDAG
ncbi:MAG: MotA/TolQ/ExbB proton channel family protein [Gammaproteobacteria bacterium]|nr:MotA/TolQ/ExbB proton channel family protein [Pseudomonadales bacterium]MCP5348090.1 MotA/TolQ/ExbB proton channel family protein [Pseudomonadales bacterium]